MTSFKQSILFLRLASTTADLIPYPSGSGIEEQIPVPPGWIQVFVPSLVTNMWLCLNFCSRKQSSGSTVTIKCFTVEVDLKVKACLAGEFFASNFIRFCWYNRKHLGKVPGTYILIQNYWNNTYSHAMLSDTLVLMWHHSPLGIVCPCMMTSRVVIWGSTSAPTGRDLIHSVRNACVNCILR